MSRLVFKFEDNFVALRGSTFQSYKHAIKRWQRLHAILYNGAINDTPFNLVLHNNGIEIEERDDRQEALLRYARTREQWEAEQHRLSPLKGEGRPLHYNSPTQAIKSFTEDKGLTIGKPENPSPTPLALALAKPRVARTADDWKLIANSQLDNDMF